MNGLRSFRVFRLACIFFVVGRISGARVQARPKVLPFDEFRASYSTADEPDQSYTDHHLFVAAVETSHDKENLDRLEEETPALSFWGPSLVSSNVSILVPPEMAADFQKSLGKFKIAYTVASQNLQSWIDHERAENPPQNLFLIGSEPSRFSLNQYHSFEEISAYLDGIAAKYPDIVQANTIGTSYEGRPIKGLKIASPQNSNKPVVWIDSGIHAREWIAPASSLFIIDRLVKGASSDPTVRALLSSYEFHIYPLINPDGYVRTWTGDRMWRKNRVRFQGYSCMGVDPNRNFGHDFGGPGTSGDVCSDIYRGPEAFSELEAQAVRDGLRALGPRAKMYFAVHSYSQLIMMPYGSGSRIQSHHYNDQLQVARAGQRAISAYSGLHYRVGTIQQLLSKISGGAADWAMEGAGVKYSYVIELRDRGQFGFLLPASQILPTSEEFYRSLTAMVDEVSRKESGKPLVPANSHGPVNRVPQQPSLPQWPPVWG